ncbi:hypothetical protein EVAR_40823_1 [Eumeta japonica]|uniref:Uncharacterized protein n=1 Tax=Eumeta variegata TaxID=151549 RepID=A0A4C1WGJ4_EUMVA|nr:hypothetical protein EVAR_40823_1 [Eumeta japonica]
MDVYNCGRAVAVASGIIGNNSHRDYYTERGTFTDNRVLARVAVSMRTVTARTHNGHVDVTADTGCSLRVLSHIDSDIMSLWILPLFVTRIVPLVQESYMLAFARISAHLGIK